MKVKDMEDFRIIIAGSREFNNYRLLVNKVSYLIKEKSKTHNIIIISGTARGADKLGEYWAETTGYQVERYPADWNKYGKRAGYIRNKQMAEVADALIAFNKSPNGTNGTNNMIQIMKEMKKSVRTVWW